MEHLKNNKNSSTILSSDINIIIDDNTLEDPDENKKEIPDLEYLNKNNNKNNIQKKKGKNFDPDDYVLMMCIGNGNFSEIFMVEHKKTKILYAMKSFTKMRVEQLHKECDVLMEKHVREKISPHNNIIGYYGSAKDDFQMHILYEYINGGDLWKKVVVYGLNCMKKIKLYFIQILLAIKHMHSFNICHRDIKPENILITKDEKNIKIIDFGSSYDLDGTEFEKRIEEMKEKKYKGKKNRKPEFKHFVGTPNYMAPECVHNQFSDKRSDYWSLGCVLYNMITGFPPFLGGSEYLIFQKSIDCKYIFPKGIVPPLAEDLIRKCIVIEPDKRITIDEMLNHPFLKNEYDNKEFIIENLPKMTKEEEEFYNIRKKLCNKYKKIKKISKDLESIKHHERMEEDLKRNDIKPEPNENDKIMKELVDKKDEIQKEFDENLENFKNDIKELKNSYKDNEYFIDKLDFLEIQIKHDIFNIIYKGYEEENKNNDLNNDN